MHLGRNPILRLRSGGTGGRVAVRALVALLCALAGLLATAGPAAAHATLLETSPANDTVVAAAPDVVSLRFSEPVSVGGGGIRIFGPDGDRADRGSVAALEDGRVAEAALDGVTPGTYTVAWRVTSEDGHTIAGSFVFHVERVAGGVAIDASTPRSVSVLGFAARWLAYAGSLLALGALAIGALRPALRPADPAGPADFASPPAGTTQQATRVTAQTTRLTVQTTGIAFAAAAAAGLGALLLLWVLTAEGSGRSLVDAFGLVGEYAADQRTGTLTAVRAALLTLAAVVLVASRGRARAASFAAALVVGSMAATALAGHAWTTGPRAITVASDLVHQAAAGVWLGGVVTLLAVLPRVREAPRDRTALVRRFSALASVTALAVALTGVLAAWLQARSLEALTSTAHGRLILAKAAGFAVLAALGWQNRQRLIGLLERSVAPLRRSLAAETAIAVLVLAATAGAVAQQPARLALDQPFATTVTAGALTVQATVEPARVGVNEVHLYFFDEAGQLQAVDAVQVDASVGDLPPRRLTVTPISPDHVSVYGASLASPGTWTLLITAVVAGAVTTVPLEVPIR